MTSRQRCRSKAVVAAGIGTALLGLAGCGGAQQNSGADDGKTSVVTSTNVWGDMAREVGGNAVEVQPLISDPAGDPHSYESTPKDAAKVAEADLVVANGAGYDEFLEKILEATPPGKPTLEAAAVAGKSHQEPSPPQPAEHQHGHEGSGEHSVNEHFWYDMHSVDAVANQLAAELGKLQPAKAQEFTANAERFRAQVGELEAQIQQIAATRRGTNVIVTEPVAHYLIKESGLTDITPETFVNAVESENDPPAAAIAETQRALDTRQAAALIYNPQTESPATKQLRTHAEQLGIPIVPMTETLPEGQNYVQWMGSQIAQLGHATHAK